MGIYSSNRGLVVDILGNYQRDPVSVSPPVLAQDDSDEIPQRLGAQTAGMASGRDAWQIKVWIEMRLPDPALIPAGFIH